MIRINLLGTTKKGKHGSAGAGVNFSLPHVEIGSTAVIIVAALLLFAAVAGCYSYGQLLDKNHQKIASDTLVADARIRQLSAVKTSYEEEQRQKAELQRHFDVIDQLRASQSGPALALSAIGGTVNRTETVWLTKMDDDSKDRNASQITLNGYALDSVAVAHFMMNLRSSGYFSSVDLKDTHQDSYQGLPLFIFTLSCQRAPDSKPAEQKQPPQPGKKA
jgi:Tfp pilus assembly protein PilN